MLTALHYPVFGLSSDKITVKMVAGTKKKYPARDVGERAKPEIGLSTIDYRFSEVGKS
jgi:hypothetical protein